MSSNDIGIRSQQFAAERSDAARAQEAHFADQNIETVRRTGDFIADWRTRRMQEVQTLAIEQNMRRQAEAQRIEMERHQKDLEMLDSQLISQQTDRDEALARLAAIRELQSLGINQHQIEAMKTQNELTKQQLRAAERQNEEAESGTASMSDVSEFFRSYPPVQQIGDKWFKWAWNPDAGSNKRGLMTRVPASEREVKAWETGYSPRRLTDEEELEAYRARRGLGKPAQNGPASTALPTVTPQLPVEDPELKKVGYERPSKDDLEQIAGRARLAVPELGQLGVPNEKIQQYLDSFASLVEEGVIRELRANRLAAETERKAGRSPRELGVTAARQNALNNLLRHPQIGPMFYAYVAQSIGLDPEMAEALAARMASKVTSGVRPGF